MSKEITLPKVMPGHIFSRIGYVQQEDQGDSPVAAETRYPSLIQVVSAVNPFYAVDPSRDSDFCKQAEAIMNMLPSALRNKVIGRRVYRVNDIKLAFYAGNTCAIVLANLKAVKQVFESDVVIYDANHNWAEATVLLNQQIAKFTTLAKQLPVSPWINDFTKKIGFIPKTDRRPAVLHTVEVLAQLQDDDDSELFLDFDDSYFQFDLKNDIVDHLVANCSAFIDHINWALTKGTDVLQIVADLLHVYPSTKIRIPSGKLEDYRGFQLLCRNSICTYVDADDSSRVFNYNGWINADGLGGKQFNISNAIADGESAGDVFTYYESDDDKTLKSDTLIGLAFGCYNNNNDGTTNRMSATVQSSFAIIGATVISPTSIYSCSGDFKITLTNNADGDDERENFAIIIMHSLGLISAIQVEQFTPDAGSGNQNIATVLSGLNEDAIEHVLNAQAQFKEVSVNIANYMYDLGTPQDRKKDNKPDEK